MTRFICFMALLCPFLSNDQRTTDLSGTILSTDQKRLPSVSVSFAWSSLKGRTDNAGRFRIASLKIPDTLILSKDGYLTQRIPVRAKFLTPLQITLDTEQIKPLKIGDKMPDVLLEQIINAPYSSTMLSSFKGKVIILDFWATWCGSCISALHKLEPLQKKYADQFQVIAITEESAKKVRSFFKNKDMESEFTFPIIISDQNLKQYFPYRSLPHEVWLDAHQNIIAITSQNQVTENNIQAVIAGTTPEMKTKAERLDFDRRLSLDENFGRELHNQLYFQSLFAGEVPNAGGSSGYSTPRDSSTKRFYFLNSSLMGMLTTAAAFYPRPNNRVLIESDEVNKIKNKLFTYELTYPKNTPTEVMLRYMKQDLERYLSVQIEVKPRKVACWALRLANGDSSQVTTKGGKPRSDFSDRNKPEKYLINAPISILVQALNSQTLDMPIIVDETGVKGPIDLVFTGSLGDWANVQKNLAAFNLTLVPIEKEMEMLVISNTKKSSQ